jgi:hypothetical protein
VFFFDTMAVSHSFIPATIHLVLFLEVVKLYQKDRKDYFTSSFCVSSIHPASSLTIDMTFIMRSSCSGFPGVDPDEFRSASRGKTHIEANHRRRGASCCRRLVTIWIAMGASAVFPFARWSYFSRAATSSL